MIRFVSLLVALFLTAGCSQAALMERFIPEEEAVFARSYLALFQARDFAAIEGSIDPKLKDQQLRAKLEQMAALFPTETPREIRIVGAQTNTVNDTTTVTLLFEYEYSNTWLLADVVLQKTDSGPLVKGVHVQPRNESLAQTNRFTLNGKSLVHYGILAGAIIVPLVMLWAGVLAFRTPIPKRKWLWILFILTGFIQVSLDWTTGRLNVNPLSFQFLGAGFMKSGAYAPVIIITSVPLGAIVFLLRRKKWLAQPGDPPGKG